MFTDLIIGILGKASFVMILPHLGNIKCDSTSVYIQHAQYLGACMGVSRIANKGHTCY